MSRSQTVAHRVNYKEPSGFRIGLSPGGKRTSVIGPGTAPPERKVMESGTGRESPMQSRSFYNLGHGMMQLLYVWLFQTSTTAAKGWRDA